MQVNANLQTYKLQKAQIMIKKEDRICPDCQSQLMFTPDGRGLLCERCGHRRPIKRPIPPVDELVKAQRLLPRRGKPRTKKTSALRTTLRQGIADVKAKKHQDAFFYLNQIVLSPDADGQIRAEAWLWLSQLYKELTEKRLCLEQVIALQPGHGRARRGLALIDGRLHQDEIIDPDKLKQTASDEPEIAQAEQFTCPRCASRMNYAPDGQGLQCDFCGYKEEGEGETAVAPEFGVGGIEQDFAVGMAKASGHMHPISTRVLQCHGCAVEFVLAPETLSVTCPYCNHVYVTETAETHEIAPPQALIPLSISEEQAQKQLRGWQKKHNLQDKPFSALIGIYHPAWTFDLGGEIKWNGQIKKGDNWVSTSGITSLMLDDFLLSAQPKPHKRLQQSCQDFDLAQLVAYDAHYLAAWPAERYTLSMSDASLAARKMIVNDYRRNSHKLTHGEYVRNIAFNLSGIMMMSYKLILLPLWTTHFTVDDKTYQVYINGQNGRLRADKPSGVVGKFFSWLKGE